MVGNRRGFTLLEIAAAIALAALVSLSAMAVLQSRAMSLRDAYEERAAWEVAAGRLALIEAGALTVKDGRLPVSADEPGWDNLLDPECSLKTKTLEEGLVRATVSVSWTGLRGVRRTVEAGTLVRGTR